MKQNLKLLNAIRQKGLRQYEFASIVGIDQYLLSRLIRGHVNLDPVRKLRIAKALKRRVSDLFDD